MIHKIMKRSLQEAEKRKGKKTETKKGGGTGTETRTEVGTRTGTGIRTKIMIGIEIDTGNGHEVKEGNVAGVLKMMIITAVVGIMIDGESMMTTGRTDVGVLGLGLGQHLIIDQGHAHGQDRDHGRVLRVKGSVDLIWLHQLLQCWLALLFQV